MKKKINCERLNFNLRISSYLKIWGVSFYISPKFFLLIRCIYTPLAQHTKLSLLGKS